MSKFNLIFQIIEVITQLSDFHKIMNITLVMEALIFKIIANFLTKIKKKTA